MNVVGFVLILFLSILFIATVLGSLFSWPFTSYIFPTNLLLSYIGAFSAFVAVSFPLLLGIFFVFRLFFGTRVNKTLRTSIFVFWVLNLVGLVSIGSFVARDFKFKNYAAPVMQTVTMTEDVLEVELGEIPNWDWDLAIENVVGFEEQNLLAGNIDIKILRGNGSEVVVEYVKSARGETGAVADNRISNIDFDVDVAANKVVVPRTISVEKGKRWRNQQVELIIHLPVGKSIQLKDRAIAGKYIDEIEFDGPFSQFRANSTKVWTMTERGLECASCDSKTFSTSTESDFPAIQSDIEEVVVKGDINVIIELADSDMEINIDEEEKNVITTESNGQLVVELKSDQPAHSTVYIRMASLVDISAMEGSNVELRGFDQSEMNINCRGNGSYIKTEMDVDNVSITQAGNNRIDLNGTYVLVDAVLSNDAHLEGAEAMIKDVNISLQENSFATFNDGINSIKEESDESSEVKIED